MPCPIVFVAKVITFFNDLGPHDMLVGCWERSLNISLFVRLFKHLTILILSVHKTRVEHFCNVTVLDVTRNRHDVLVSLMDVI